MPMPIPMPMPGLQAAQVVEVYRLGEQKTDYPFAIVGPELGAGAGNRELGTRNKQVATSK